MKSAFPTSNPLESTQNAAPELVKKAIVSNPAVKVGISVPTASPNQSGSAVDKQTLPNTDVTGSMLRRGVTVPIESEMMLPLSSANNSFAQPSANSSFDSDFRANLSARSSALPKPSPDQYPEARISGTQQSYFNKYGTTLPSSLATYTKTYDSADAISAQGSTSAFGSTYAIRGSTVENTVSSNVKSSSAVHVANPQSLSDLRAQYEMEVVKQNANRTDLIKSDHFNGSVNSFDSIQAALSNQSSRNSGSTQAIRELSIDSTASLHNKKSGSAHDVANAQSLNDLRAQYEMEVAKHQTASLMKKPSDMTSMYDAQRMTSSDSLKLDGGVNTSLSNLVSGIEERANRASVAVSNRSIDNSAVMRGSQGSSQFGSAEMSGVIPPDGKQEIENVENHGIWGGGKSSIALSRSLESSSSLSRTSSVVSVSGKPPVHKGDGKQHPLAVQATKNTFKQDIQKQIDDYKRTPIADLMRAIGELRDWHRDEVEQDIMVFESNRIRKVGDIAYLSKETWGTLPVPVIVKDILVSMMQAEGIQAPN